MITSPDPNTFDYPAIIKPRKPYIPSFECETEKTDKSTEGEYRIF
jgi:hypothetical protein